MVEVLSAVAGASIGEIVSIFLIGTGIGYMAGFRISQYVDRKEAK